VYFLASSEASVSARKTAEQGNVIRQRAPSPTYTALDHSSMSAAPNQYHARGPVAKGRVQRQTSDNYLKPEDHYDYISTSEDANAEFSVVFHK